jgi:integrase
MGGRVSGPQYRLTRLRGKWAVAVYQDGQRTERLTLGTRDRKEADRLLARFIADRQRPREITVAYLWQRYREENAHKHVTINMGFSGRAVLPELGHLLPEEITTQHCRAYVAKRRKAGKAPGTIWTELNHLQIALSWAKKQKLSPEVSIERPPKPPPRDRRLTRAEGERLLASADIPHVALAIALMLGTGARAGAILTLTWDRVDFERRQIQYADPDDTKRRKGRATVPMTESLRQRLQAARQDALTPFVVEWAGRPVKSIKRGFARTVERAGLKDVSPHVLRHTAASWLAERGVPMTEIAAILGHSDSRMTERVYARFSPTYLRIAINALEMSDVPSRPGEPAKENET